MNNKFGYHHFLLALLPVLLIWVDNINEIPIQDIIFPLIISFLIVFILWIILAFLIGEKKSAVIISILIMILMIFAYTRLILGHHEIEDVRFFAKNLILIPTFTLTTIFIVFKILRQKFSSNVSQIINMMSVAVLGLIIFQIGLFYSEDVYFDQAQELLNVPLFELHNLDQKPNVYLLLLDAYSGIITLENDFEFDNSKFYDDLEERGFFIQKDSFSNYPNTALSMPSIMNMNYLDFITQLPEKKSNDLRVVQKLDNQNKVMEIFKSAGYDVYSFHGNLGRSDFVTENFCKYNFDLNPELIYQLINHYVSISELREQLFEQHVYDTVLCALNTTRDFENATEKPFYMHMHVIFPHQPFLFDAEGNKIKDVHAVDRFDGKLKDAYLQQLIFANKKTLEIIDSIQQRNSNDVIILMSDHGGRFDVNWVEPSEIDYFRGLENLKAVYFPGKESDIPSSIATVNTFRIFFNTYFNTNYEILDEKMFWYEPETPFIQKDVTELIQNSSLRE
jgi:hypothetical protein